MLNQYILVFTIMTIFYLPLSFVAVRRPPSDCERQSLLVLLTIFSFPVVDAVRDAPFRL